MKTAKTKSGYWEEFWQLTRRHLLVFFRNKVRIFFTLMVPFIIFVIYILFLRDLELGMANNILEKLGKEYDVSLTSDATLISHINTIVDSWMMSGIIAICTITVSFQACTTIVNDREHGVNRDFVSSPISHNLLIGSYFLFNIIVTVLVCFVFILCCLIYLACLGEFMITFVDFLTIFATLLFSSVSSVLLTVFISSFISRDATMASVNTIFSTAVGFLIGAYMPLAMMPDWAQNICAFFPGTYSCSMLRYAFLSTPSKELISYIGTLGLPFADELVAQFTSSFGFGIKFFGTDVATNYQSLAQFVFIAVLIAANVVSGKKLISVIGSMGKRIKKKK